MSRDIEYDRRWREKNRQKIRLYHRLYARKRRRQSEHSPYLGTSGDGRKYEKIALSMLVGSSDKNRYSFHNAWDIEWDGKLIDVKMRRLNGDGRYGFTRKRTSKATYYLCFCVRKEKIKWIFLFPADIFRDAISISDADMGSHAQYLLKMVNI